MNENMSMLRDIPLLPDDELIAMIRETQRLSGKAEDRAGRRGSRGQEQITRRLEALNRELKARGILGQPWWAEH